MPEQRQRGRVLPLAVAARGKGQMKKYRSSFMALGRLLIALLFLWDAAMLIGAPKDSIAYVGSGLPFPEAAYAGAIAVQLIGGIGVLLGFKTRWAAALLALFCIATALFFHTNWADADTKIHFFKNLAMAGGLLQLMASGGGRWSLDAGRGEV
jgi:putative oxidoreductase